MKTVWIYVNTSKDVGDVDHIKVFAQRSLHRRRRTVEDRWITQLFRGTVIRGGRNSTNAASI
jgi:hypothetical protein